MSDIEDEEVPTEKVKIESKRIFINHVDTFNGKNLAKVKISKLCESIKT
jgi:hypothetical protein